MKARFLTCDVFTDRAFGGNQLAVFPEARAIAPELMAPIAKEFNYSETTFVLPPDDPSHTAKVRIFTPGGELQFAGHPTVGTAHVLATIGAVKLTGDETRIVLEEGVGPVPVMIRSKDGKPEFAQLSVAQLPEIGPPPPAAATLAAALSLSVGDIVQGEMFPQTVSCGTPFLLVPLKDRDAVGRARVKLDLFEEALGNYVTSKVMVFAMDAEHAGHHVRARMFAPTIGIAEDPATGSACSGLSGYLAARDPHRDGTLRWIVEQGFEMGRPSILELEADKKDGEITGVRVGGRTVMVQEGTFSL
jgi:trans-2,3-dihydro-3-hydroxyanthranilate isomerase